MSVDGRRHVDQPVLITGAARSFDDEFAARRRRYSLIMAGRIPCLVLAGVFEIGFGWTLAAVLLIVASVPLPWMAVLIANDRPPRKSEPVARYRRDHGELDNTERRALEPATVIDAPAPTDHGTDVDHLGHRSR